mmetsp:Transcript_109777/g.212550  ORF Transcript_109777/g.212550 Transcript_109777/m.212550 type:complete len:545 (-) Transcript_109777:60-1694(-)
MAAMAKMPACEVSHSLCFAAVGRSLRVTSPVSGAILCDCSLQPALRVYEDETAGTARRGKGALSWGAATGLIASLVGRGLTRRRAAHHDAKYHSLREQYAQRGVPTRGDDYWDWMETLFFKRARMSAGINFDKYDDVEVETLGGKGDEEPVVSFEDLCQKFELPEELVANLERCKYSKPTPVQKYSMPAVLSGSDVMVSAQTGSGKTAAFLTPVVATVLKAGEKPVEPGAARPTAVVLAPTRELVQQLATEAKRLCHRTFIRIASVYGGAPQGQQLEEVAEGANILIATPGRLDDFLARGLLTMEDVQFLAVDEADRMLDMGFEPQIRRIVDEFGMPAPGIDGEGRRTMMFSATFPQEMQDMALDFLHPSYLWIGVGRVGEMVSNVVQRFEDVGFGDKHQTLSNVLQRDEKTIVFANMKRTVDDISRQLQSTGIRAAPIHGGIEQQQRDGAISALKSGRVSVLVATEVAARGLDIPGVDHVVNFDLPTNGEDYTHRIGRTGRIGNKGVATTLVGEREAALKHIVKTIKKGDVEVPDWLLEMTFM